MGDPRARRAVLFYAARTKCLKVRALSIDFPRRKKEEVNEVLFKEGSSWLHSPVNGSPPVKPFITSGDYALVCPHQVVYLCFFTLSLWSKDDKFCLVVIRKGEPYARCQPKKTSHASG